MNLRLIALSSVTLLTACTAYLNEISPTPNVLLPNVRQTIALRLAPEVLDAFEVPDDNPSLKLVVTRWRVSLSTAFYNGYARYFAPRPLGAKPDLTLVILRADPRLIYAGRGNFALTSAQVRFQAELLDSHDVTLKTWGDTAISRETIVSGDYAGPPLRSAIEAMFEEIANGMPRLAQR